MKYSDRSDTLSDRYMHLTNYSINKLSANYAKNEDANSYNGHKWTIKTLWKYFAEQHINTDGLWAALRNLVLRTILAGENVINQMSKSNVVSKYNTFELFGIDVILDSELKPWLLEVNISPSLHSSSPLDLYVKGPLVTALLNTVRYQVPPRLSPAQQEEIMKEQGLKGNNLCFDKRLHMTNLSKIERIKHNRFSQKSVNREQVRGFCSLCCSFAHSKFISIVCGLDSRQSNSGRRALPHRDRRRIGSLRAARANPTDGNVPPLPTLHGEPALLQSPARRVGDEVLEEATRGNQFAHAIL